MEKKVLVLDDHAEDMGTLVKLLMEDGCSVRVCFSPLHALDEIAVDTPQVLIAAGEFPEMNAHRLAQMAYNSRQIPAFVILDSAGDTTQSDMLRHPGIIGTYYRPLKVQKLFSRIQKFLEK